MFKIDSLFLISHSPFGKFSPGAREINDIFQAMWREAEQNRTKWGCKLQHLSLLFAFHSAVYTNLYGFGPDLGRIATLVDYSDSERTPTISLSYWKGLKGLQEFSASAAHRLGQNDYNAKKYPYMGIMHETFYASKGYWETVHGDFPS